MTVEGRVGHSRRVESGCSDASGRPQRALAVHDSWRSGVAYSFDAGCIRAVAAGANCIELDDSLDLHLLDCRRIMARAPQDGAATLAGHFCPVVARGRLPVAHPACKPAAGLTSNRQPHNQLNSII